MTSKKWWVDPKGKPYWMSGSQEHQDFAAKILSKDKKFNDYIRKEKETYDYEPNIPSLAYLFLHRKGWVRGGRDNNVVYFAFMSDEAKISKQTRDTMFDIAMITASKIDFVEFEFEDSQDGMSYSDSSDMDDVERTIMRRI